jgi:hemolysin activation/secretion protein
MHYASVLFARKIKPFHVSLILAAGCGFLPVAGFAQSLPNAGSLLKELRDGERPPEASGAPDVITPLVRPTLRLPDGATVTVASFKITGNTSIPTQELQALLKEWEGRVLDLAGLNEASGALTRYYQARGFILSYAYLPAQKVENNMVEIAILEGRVGAVQVVAAQDVRLDDQVIQNHVGNRSTAQTAHKDALERQLLLLNDIPGVVARAAFTPGGEAGSSDMVVSVVEEAPLTSTVFINNYGSQSTGEQRLGAQFQLRDVFGAGDATQLGATWASGGGLASGSMETSLPLGGNGLTLHAGVSHLTYALQQSFSDLGARGVADSVHAGLWYALRRTATSNVSLRSDLQFSGLQDLIPLVGVETRKSSSSVMLGVNLDGQDDWLGGGRSRAQVSYHSGTLQIDSGTDALQTAGGFGKSLLDLSREQRLTENAVLYARAVTQQADKNLDSSEKFSLSGPYAVRAYAPGELSVDQGNLLTLEVRYQMPMPGGTLTWSLFGDYANGAINRAPLPGVTDNDATLNGSGMGLSWRTGADLEFSLTAAWRGTRLPSVDGDRAPRIFFQLTKGL